MKQNKEAFYLPNLERSLRCVIVLKENHVQNNALDMLPFLWKEEKYLLACD